MRREKQPTHRGCVERHRSAALDRIDEWMMNYLTEFDGKAFQSVAKADESIEKLADRRKRERSGKGA